MRGPRPARMTGFRPRTVRLDDGCAGRGCRDASRSSWEASISADLTAKGASARQGPRIDQGSSPLSELQVSCAACYCKSKLCCVLLRVALCGCCVRRPGLPRRRPRLPRGACRCVAECRRRRENACCALLALKKKFSDIRVARALHLHPHQSLPDPSSDTRRSLEVCSMLATKTPEPESIQGKGQEQEK
eukprot:scaffold68_cov128-Isochrysis_galbana.AAC.5